MFRNPFEEFRTTRKSLFDKDDFLFGDSFFGKEIDNWFNDDFFKFPLLGSEKCEKERPSST